MMSVPTSPLGIGVIIVTYNSADVILECLESLLASDYDNMRIVLCDNASSDRTVDVIRSWAAGKMPFKMSHNSPLPSGPAAPKPLNLTEYPSDKAATLRYDEFGRVTLLRSDLNCGFASGVNIGLAALRPQRDIELFWILNPDCVVARHTARVYIETAKLSQPFSLMGCRTVFYTPSDRIQTDGGRVWRWSGICESVHKGELADDTSLPDPASLDYISGANMVASRTFVDKVGTLEEDYFLYYEEVDWAFRRGDLPLILAQDALVYHHGGTTIGSGTLTKRPSAFANYFNFRNRMRFLFRFGRASILTAYPLSMIRIVRLAFLGAWEEAIGAACGLYNLAPPREVLNRLDSSAAKLAFSNRKSSPDDRR